MRSACQSLCPALRTSDEENVIAERKTFLDVLNSLSTNSSGQHSRVLESALFVHKFVPKKASYGELMLELLTSVMLGLITFQWLSGWTSTRFENG